ncbi:DNA mismatch repair protein MutS [Thermomicrobium sp. 4228-Ro]|uniref:DNA mismatch repair protein MutS n=1 Tax=Thermomicrobium sp. 4228-Ro TaxID=2993937 RepID=UPI002249415D|nr:DNA mismatch repair protein MutS [Thermomicrobium sp. 4228-Ro]MCX2727618.1 DNA mismatch repair protein MutS [Thermomicrobium sp. 4228-Ro]
MTTPIRRQYLAIKRQVPDALLLFRLGDFYELFDEDAEIASRILDIALTSRDLGRGQRVPMAGIPAHAAEPYIAKLVAAGYRVALCDQIGTPDGRRLVERRITRVLTPGTLTEPAMLDAKRNTYVAALIVEEARAGIAFAELSTGEFAATEIVSTAGEDFAAAIERELLRIAPAELVVPVSQQEQVPDIGAVVTPTEDRAWRERAARETLHEHFRVASLEAFGLEERPAALRAAGALLQYLQETQAGNVPQLDDLVVYRTDSFMTLDAATRRNLELLEPVRGGRESALIAVLDRTRTPMGARLLRRWLGQPLLDVRAIVERQERVAALVEESLARMQLGTLLAEIADLERLANRLLTERITPRELQHLGRSIASLPRLAELLRHRPELAALVAFPDLQLVAQLVERALVDEPPVALGQGAVIRPGFAPELDELRSRAHAAREWIASLEQRERERTGIRSLKVGYNKVFGYYIEVSNANRHLVPEDYQRKQTLVGAERYITPELKEYEQLVLHAEERIAALESEVYRRVVGEIAAYAGQIKRVAQQVAELDVYRSLADLAVERRYVRPIVDDSTALEIIGGRHPVVEATMEAGRFVPNDTYLDTQEEQIVILTGPNMAGKSTYLRQVALIVLLAQIGSFVPAERARIGLVDRIFTRIGAQDDIASGQSTFMVEMVETATILRQATLRSLVVLDEVGRGTSTYDGLAIARAVVEYLHNHPRLGCRTLFATHYHELTELERVLPRVRNYRMDVLEEGDSVVFLHRVVRGGADKSYGIHVAQLAGLPHAVVRRAREILAELEAAGSGERGRRRRALATAVPVTVQLTLFGPPHPVIERLKALELDALTPLEALTILYELQRMLQEHEATS